MKGRMYVLLACVVILCRCSQAGASMAPQPQTSTDSNARPSPTPAPLRVKLGETIVIPQSGIEISLTKVVLGADGYQGMRPSNPAGRPENDGVLAVVGKIAKGNPDDFWAAGQWITDEKDKRNAKDDQAGMSTDEGVILLFNAPKSSHKLWLHLGNSLTIDLAPFLAH
jgi:hypothetical protein